MIVIVILIPILGAILAGEGLNGWYKTLNMPFLNIPFWLFITVQIIYYIICVIILSRILFFIKGKKSLTHILTIFFVFMMTAELWNFFFIGLKSTINGFIGMIVFTVIAIILFINLRAKDKVSSYILLPYLLWLIFDNVWIFDLWRINR